MNLLRSFPNRITSFIKAANKNKLRMIMVGGGAVNFYGYQRHSADIDFWIDIEAGNLQNLLHTLRDLEYQIDDLPDAVKQGVQNISINISPVFELELITNFNPGKSFSDAFSASQMVKIDGLEYRVLNFEDLIQSKISSDRPKDKLDVEELHKIQLRKQNGI